MVFRKVVFGLAAALLVAMLVAPIAYAQAPTPIAAGASSLPATGGARELNLWIALLAGSLTLIAGGVLWLSRLRS